MEDEEDEEDEDEAFRTGSRAACCASISRRACSRMERMASSEPLPPLLLKPMDEEGGIEVSAAGGRDVSSEMMQDNCMTTVQYSE